MTNKSAATFTVVLAALAAMAPCVIAADSGWDLPWSFRRLVAVPPSQKWKDAGIAEVSFRAGDIAPGSALTVMVEGERGVRVPAKVVWAAPLKSASVLFEAKPDSRYFLYYGPLEGAEPSPPLEAKRGLILETRPRPAGRCNSYADFQALVKRSASPFGAAPVPNVFLGHNPFGSSRDVISIFRGFIKAPKSGEYSFCTASSDSSFVFIDGREVVSWPGRHPPGEGLWGKKRGTVELTEGLHEFEYCHETSGSAPAAVLGWFPGNGERPALVPPEFFPGFLSARAGRLQKKGVAEAADFDFRPQGMTRVGEAYLYGVEFEAAKGSRGEIEWDFGDGLKAAGGKVTHVFLQEKTYKVRMKLISGGESDEFVQDLDASILMPHWQAQEPPQSHLDLMRGYDLSALDRESRLALLSLFAEYGHWKDSERLLSSLLADGGDAGPQRRLADGLELARLRAGLGNPAGAVEALRTVEPLAAGGSHALSIEYGLSLCSFLAGAAGADEAAEKLEAVAGKALAAGRKDLAGLATAAMGHVKLAGGDWKGAQEFYAKARETAGRPSGGAALVKKGANASKVLQLLEQKKYEKAREELWRWEEEFPEERVEGYTADLRCRSFMAESSFADAVKSADSFLSLGRPANFTPALLYMKGVALWGMNDHPAAAEALKRLISEYPEDSRREKAEGLLKRMK